MGNNWVAVQCADNKAEYFAKRLHKSMVGLGTRENDLTRVLVSRCEIDLANIRKEYETHFKKPLAKAVAVRGPFFIVLT